jgi:hypothetical protein
MSARVVPDPAGEAAAPVPPQAIQAIDLTNSPGSRGLWRPPGASPDDTSLAPPPGPGRPSPMGFWLTDLADSRASAPTALRLRIVAPGAEPERVPTDAGPTPGGERRRPAQTIRLKGANAAEGDVVLTLGPAGAEIVAGAAAWEALAEPVLLAVCQSWRFRALDAELDRLTAQAEGDLAHAAMSVPATLWHRRRLLSRARGVRALLLDLPHFQEPLTDPYPFCSSERSAQAYRTLAEKLHLEAWAEAIDHRAEAVEDTYASVTEKLCEYRNFAWGAFLEVVIVLILLADLIIRAWEYYSA